MFFHIYLDRNMQLHPRHFGPHLRDKLIAKLIQDVEGTCRWVPSPYCLGFSVARFLVRLAEEFHPAQ